MSAVSLSMHERQQAVALARMSAISTAVEINHRYRMTRVEAELKAISVRRRMNIMRSSYVRGAALLLALTACVGGGWMASDYARTSAVAASAAPAPVAAAISGAQSSPSVPVASAGPQAEGSGHAIGPVSLADTPPALSQIDEVEVPFVREVSQLGKMGLAAVESFQASNTSAQQFRVSGIQASGETVETARSRAISVAQALLGLGVPVESIQMLPPTQSQAANSIVGGVRLESYGPQLREMATIAAGTPFATTQSQDDSALMPAFKPTPIQLEAAQPAYRLPSAQIVPAAKAEPDQSQELENAVKSAVIRRQQAVSKPKGTDAVKPDGPGVFVKVPERAAPNAASPSAAVQPPAKSSPAYTIVSELDGAVLIKQGNQVRHVRVGEVLPDGRVLSKDLAPLSSLR